MQESGREGNEDGEGKERIEGRRRDIIIPPPPFLHS